MTPQLLFALLLLLVAAACTPPPKKASIPAPPPIQPEAPKPRKITPGPNDRAIHGCTLTRESKDSIDCVCRGISDRIDSVSGAHTIECKPLPRKEPNAAKH